MTESFANINGTGAVRATVTIPNRGPWYADVELSEAPALSGRITLAVGDLVLSGTVDPRADGTIRETRRTRIIGGAGGWARLLPTKHYHNDLGVKPRLVAQDAAREAGETLGNFAPVTSLGVDYVRPSGAASAALDDAIGDSVWWVDYAGVTQVGTRSTSTPAEGAYIVEDFDPRIGVATLALDDLRAIVIGSVLSEGLDAPQTVRELVISCEPEGVRVRAWCGGDATGRGRIATLLRAIVARVVREEAPGPVKYRVSRLNEERVELQIVNRRSGLPDLVPVSMWPGVAGIHAQLTPGAEVLVEFIDGDRTQPIVTHFAGKGGAGFVPAFLNIGDNPTDFMALAGKVLTELGTIRTWANTHTHGGVTAGAGTTATGLPTLAAAGSVASALVRSK